MAVMAVHLARALAGAAAAAAEVATLIQTGAPQLCIPKEFKQVMEN
jgi:hypothetical protein